MYYVLPASCNSDMHSKTIQHPQWRLFVCVSERSCVCALNFVIEMPLPWSWKIPEGSGMLVFSLGSDVVPTTQVGLLWLVCFPNFCLFKCKYVYDLFPSLSHTNQPNTIKICIIINVPEGYVYVSIFTSFKFLHHSFFVMDSFIILIFFSKSLKNSKRY